MEELIDISRPLRDGMIVWPGSRGVRLTRTLSHDRGDPVTVSYFQADVHAGTHVDAPLHFLRNASPVERLPLEVLVGPAFVADLSDVESVNAGVLGATIPSGIVRILVRTRNSSSWNDDATFDTEFVALTADAASWLVEAGVRLVGIDGPSIQRFRDGPEAHEILLRAGVTILEGLDLKDARTGHYDLICLPILLEGAEAAPARAILSRGGRRS